MFRRLQTYVMSFMQKLVPWTVSNVSGDPNRKTHFSSNAFVTSAAVIVERGTAITYFKK